jgi:flavin-binding protein dodecin
MVQKVIEVVGISPESFAKAAEAAVQEAAKTIHGIRWARISDLEMQLNEKNVLQYRCLARIFFDIDR